MIERSLYHIVFDNQWGRQMRFITGPRQSGKTTLARIKLKKEECEKLYYLWDLRAVRDRYRADELFFTKDIPPAMGTKRWLCFDEIHKIAKWKNILKGQFDQTQEHYRFIVTGSTKLSAFKKAGDSLSGRYFTFQLFPLTLKEICRKPRINFKESTTALHFVLDQLNTNEDSVQGGVEHLFEYGGFPEPFIQQSKTFLRKWSQDYLDRVITEDIGLMTRIADRDRLYELYKILPEMVASPISENSLAGHLESNPVTIKNYLKKLEDFFLAFHVNPYSRNIKRSLLKASKWYLYDWTRIADAASRFENFIAVELHTRLSLWTDLTGVQYSLFYLRDKQKRETDFLIVKEKKPWLMVEVKYSDATVDTHHLQIARFLGNIPVVQVCYKENIAFQQAENIFRMSAAKFLI